MAEKPIKDSLMELYEEAHFTPQMRERAEKITEATLNYEKVASGHKFEGGYPKEVREAWAELADLCYGDEHNLQIIRFVNRQFLNGRIAGGKRYNQPQLAAIMKGFELHETVEKLMDNLDWVMTHSITATELAANENKPSATNYNPVSSIAGCLGKKSERPYFLLDDEYRVVGNLTACTCLLVEKTMDFVDPPTFYNLDGEPCQPLPLKIDRWRNLRTHPWAGSTDLTLDLEKLNAAVQAIYAGQIPKKFVPKDSKADTELPAIILNFGETFGCVAFRYPEFKMFLEAAQYIGAKVVIFADACSQLVAAKSEEDFERDGSFVAVMPMLLDDCFPEERMFVIET